MKENKVFQAFMAQRKILQKFHDEAAYSTDFAKTLSELDMRTSPILKKLIRHSVIVNNGYNQYFLDERARMKYRMKRAKWGMVLMFIILILFVFFVRK